MNSKLHKTATLLYVRNMLVSPMISYYKYLAMDETYEFGLDNNQLIDVKTLLQLG